MRFMSLRALFLLGFVVVMPVLALPPVARWMDELLYGPPPGDFGLPRTGAQPVAQEVIQPLVAERDSPAAVNQGSAKANGPRGLEGPLAQAPPMPVAPDFAPLVPSPQPAAGAEVA